MQPLPPGFFPNYPLEIDYLRVLLWLILTALIGFGLYRLYQYWQLQQQAQSKPQAITPAQQESLWQLAYTLFTLPVPADIRKYYFASSEALNACLGFAELTIAEIRFKHFAESAVFLQALTLAELVKFAKYMPTLEETTQYRQWALTVLQANKPQESAL